MELAAVVTVLSIALSIYLVRHNPRGSWEHTIGKWYLYLLLSFVLVMLVITQIVGPHVQREQEACYANYQRVQDEAAQAYQDGDTAKGDRLTQQWENMSCG